MAFLTPWRWYHWIRVSSAGRGVWRNWYGHCPSSVPSSAYLVSVWHLSPGLTLYLPPSPRHLPCSHWYLLSLSRGWQNKVLGGLVPLSSAWIFNCVFFLPFQKVTGAAGGALPKRSNGKLFLGIVSSYFHTVLVSSPDVSVSAFNLVLSLAWCFRWDYFF